MKHLTAENKSTKFWTTAIKKSPIMCSIRQIKNNAQFIGMGQKKLAAHISPAGECHTHSSRGKLTDKICFLVLVTGSGDRQIAWLFRWWLIMNVTEKVFFTKCNMTFVKKTIKLIFLITTANMQLRVWKCNASFIVTQKLWYCYSALSHLTQDWYQYSDWYSKRIMIGIKLYSEPTIKLDAPTSAECYL